MANRKVYMLLLRLSVIVHSFFINTFCISHKMEHYNYIPEVVNQHSSGVPPFVVDLPPLWFRSSPSPSDPFHFLRPRLILWDPICQRTFSGGTIAIPLCCDDETFLRPAHWKDGRNGHNAPRLCLQEEELLTWLVVFIVVKMSM